MDFMLDLPFQLSKVQGRNCRGDGETAVAPKFSDTLTLSEPRGADSAHHHRGRS